MNIVGPGLDKRDLKGIKVKINVFKQNKRNGLTFPGNLKRISLFQNDKDLVYTMHFKYDVINVITF